MSTAELTSQLEARRQQLEMSKAAVARRSRVSLPTVNRILSGKESRLSVDNVSAIAAVLGMCVQLGVEECVLPIDDALTWQEKQAERKARRVMKMVQSNMALEGQAVDESAMDQMVRKTVHELMAGPRQRLWDD